MTARFRQNGGEKHLPVMRHDERYPLDQGASAGLISWRALADRVVHRVDEAPRRRLFPHSPNVTQRLNHLSQSQSWQRLGKKPDLHI